LNFQEYLQSFWPALQAAQDLYGSVRQALQEKEADGSQREFPEHLPAQVLEAGIKSGRFVQVWTCRYSGPGCADGAPDWTVSPAGNPEREQTPAGVLVAGSKSRNRAVHGDLVAVELLPRVEWRGKVTALSEGPADERSGDDDEIKPMPTGRVVGILQRNWRDYVVTFPPRDAAQTQSRAAQRVLAVPWDRRIPKVRISTQQADALQDHRVVVRIDSWPSTSLYPNGHSVRVLGRAGELETEVQTVLVENCIHVPPFSEAQVEIGTGGQLVTGRHRSERDLLELGVHIADVTHFVREESLTDLEARATTYYLADRRYDMLPAVLSADLCSLLGGVDRSVLSAPLLTTVSIGPNAVLCRRSNVIEIILNVNQFFSVAEEEGSVSVVDHKLLAPPPQVRAQLDQDKNITALVPRQPLEVHETVAECMIYANHWVARKIQEAFPYQALLRRHPQPRQELFSQLVDTARARGFSIDTRTNKALADSLDRAVDPEDPLVNRLFRMMATQAMSQAMYFSTGAQPEDQFYHYGLALDRYTHFTSPIRRYADMVVHRLLTAALQLERGGQQGAEPGKPPAGNKDMEELAEHINSRNRVSGLLGLGGSVLPEHCLSCCDVGRRPSEPRTFPPDSSSASSSRSATRRRTRAAWPTPSSTPSGTTACWSSFQSKELSSIGLLFQ
uniref:DIS3-like exonuclease 1 n=1 Tax=Xiphophorus couchianus TaxID=32473 RepID=A0A3B5KVS8_9TELE